MRFSPAAYELAKLVAVEQLYSKDFCDEYYISSSINEDECRNQVGSLFRVYNKKKDGTQGTFLKFTVNFYHTTSSILIKGNHVEIFESELFHPVCEQIKLRCSELTIVNEQIADVLTKETSGPQLKSITGSESQSRAEGVCIKDTEPCATTKLIEGSDHSSRSNEEQDKEEQYFCPACEQSSMSFIKKQ